MEGVLRFILTKVKDIPPSAPKYTTLHSHDAVELQPVAHDGEESASLAGPCTAGTRLDDRLMTTAVISLSSVMEKLDEQLLPSVYPYVARSLQASPAALGYLTLSRALVQSLASPLGGVLGHTYNRVRVVCAGCALWTVMTALFVGATEVWQGCLLWAVNGIGLALVVPNCQSIVADDWYVLFLHQLAFLAMYSNNLVVNMLAWLLPLVVDMLPVI